MRKTLSLAILLGSVLGLAACNVGGAMHSMDSSGQILTANTEPSHAVRAMDSSGQILTASTEPSHGMRAMDSSGQILTATHK